MLTGFSLSRSWANISLAGGKFLSHHTSPFKLNMFRRRYEKIRLKMVFAEVYMDTQASFVKRGAWLRGLSQGLDRANRAAAGLT